MKYDLINLFFNLKHLVQPKVQASEVNKAVKHGRGSGVSLFCSIFKKSNITSEDTPSPHPKKFIQGPLRVLN